jgi:predicted amidohydrolase YtcJ
LVLNNGKIVTVDESQPLARALAIRGDTIIAVGSDEQIAPYISSKTKVIDLKGRLAIPGFIDGHGHFMSLGLSKMRLVLNDCSSYKEIVAKVEQAVSEAQPGDWILGRGWHQEKWNQPPEPNLDGLPFHHDLSNVSKKNPVVLYHASGHSCIANAKAMELAGITKDTPDPPGGQIVRDHQGKAIGFIRETAMDRFDQVREKSLASRTPAQVESERRQAVEFATRDCLSKGVTSFQDAGASFEVIDFYKRLAESGELGIRLWVMISEGNDTLMGKLKNYRIIDHGDRRLTVRAIKRLIDGALGAHGAWLLEPYSDLLESVGLIGTPVDSIRATAELAIADGFQLCVHAIGDRGNREILDLYEATFQQHPGKCDLRWRVEHAQHLHPDDVPRFASLSVIASMQGIHCTSDGPWVPKRLGDKRSKEGAYAWRSLLDSGAVVSNGTDTPVEAVDPIANFHALVTRKMKDGSAFYPEQRMTRDEALRAYTYTAAYAAFEEKSKGSLTPGKLADIVVLSRDILTIPEDDIPGTEVLFTILGGKVLYQSP